MLLLLTLLVYLHIVNSLVCLTSPYISPSVTDCEELIHSIYALPGSSRRRPFGTNYTSGYDTFLVPKTWQLRSCGLTVDIQTDYQSDVWNVQDVAVHGYLVVLNCLLKSPRGYYRGGTVKGGGHGRLNVTLTGNNPTVNRSSDATTNKEEVHELTSDHGNIAKSGSNNS